MMVAHWNNKQQRRYWRRELRRFVNASHEAHGVLTTWQTYFPKRFGSRSNTTHTKKRNHSFPEMF